MKRTHIISAISIIKILIITLFIFVLFNIAKNVKAAVPENSGNNFICTSVKIGEGDTLWDIAEEYYTEDYRDINSYIEEIKQTNSLRSDVIHEGNYLVIPHYAK